MEEAAVGNAARVRFEGRRGRGSSVGARERSFTPRSAAHDRDDFFAKGRANERVADRQAKLDRGIAIYPCADNARCSAKWRARRLSQTATGQRQRPRGKAAHRLAVHRANGSWGAPDRPHAERGGLSDRSQARAQARRSIGDRARGQAENDRSRAGTRSFSLPAARSVVPSGNQVGRPTSPISRSAAAFSTWSPSSTGRAGGISWRLSTPWTPRFAWRRWRRRWPAMANRTSSTNQGASSPARLSPAC